VKALLLEGLKRKIGSKYSYIFLEFRRNLISTRKYFVTALFQKTRQQKNFTNHQAEYKQKGLVNIKGKKYKFL
jgi:hypothetical protein